MQAGAEYKVDAVAVGTRGRDDRAFGGQGGIFPVQGAAQAGGRAAGSSRVQHAQWSLPRKSGWRFSPGSRSAWQAARRDGLSMAA